MSFSYIRPETSLLIVIRIIRIITFPISGITRTKIICSPTHMVPIKKKNAIYIIYLFNEGIKIYILNIPTVSNRSYQSEWKDNTQVLMYNIRKVNLT